MIEANRFPTWQESAHRLVAVAAGREPADLVVRGATWVNVQSREKLPNQDFAVVAGRFAYCGPDASHCIGDLTEVIEADGLLAIPGLCDGHMHIESGMLTPARFAEAVIPHGTTTMFADPHEIANVLGLPGVRLMLDEALNQLINIFLQVPSCVPSAPEFETAGAEITPRDVVEAMRWTGIVGLGEMMNFPGVVAGNNSLLAEIAAAQDTGKVVGGHYASPDLGREFHAYAASGAADDHEGTRKVDAIARARLGMRSMLRLGSAWHDVESQISAITEDKIDSRNFILCTDDCHSGTLVNDGHMDRVVRHAIECGCDPLEALQMATINTATHFGFERELGSIAPGRRADLVLTSCLRELPIHRVIARGKTLAENGNCVTPVRPLTWPHWVRGTVRLKRAVIEEDFRIAAQSDSGRVSAKAIGVIENQATTRSLNIDLAISNGSVECDPKRDICRLALVERHGGEGNIVNGFVSGFGYHGSMAVASTVAHDSHHIIIVGTDRRCMAAAANRLAEVGGGITVWRDMSEVALLRLPIAGLMSDAPAPEVAAAATEINSAIAKCGCKMNNAFMQHSLLALVVIPELRISNMGLVDTSKFEFVPLLSGGTACTS